MVIMKKIVLIIVFMVVVSALTGACVSGHRSQAWHPKSHK